MDKTPPHLRKLPTSEAKVASFCLKVDASNSPNTVDTKNQKSTGVGSSSINSGVASSYGMPSSVPVSRNVPETKTEASGVKNTNVNLPKASFIGNMIAKGNGSSSFRFLPPRFPPPSRTTTNSKAKKKVKKNQENVGSKNVSFFAPQSISLELFSPNIYGRLESKRATDMLQERKLQKGGNALKSSSNPQQRSRNEDSLLLAPRNPTNSETYSMGTIPKSTMSALLKPSISMQEVNSRTSIMPFMPQTMIPQTTKGVLAKTSMPQGVPRKPAVPINSTGVPVETAVLNQNSRKSSNNIHNKTIDDRHFQMSPILNPQFGTANQSGSGIASRVKLRRAMKDSGSVQQDSVQTSDFIFSPSYKTSSSGSPPKSRANAGFSPVRSNIGFNAGFNAKLTPDGSNSRAWEVKSYDPNSSVSEWLHSRSPPVNMVSNTSFNGNNKNLSNTTKQLFTAEEFVYLNALLKEDADSQRVTDADRQRVTNAKKSGNSIFHGAAGSTWEFIPAGANKNPLSAYKPISRKNATVDSTYNDMATNIATGTGIGSTTNSGMKPAQRKDVPVKDTKFVVTTTAKGKAPFKPVRGLNGATNASKPFKTVRKKGTAPLSAMKKATVSGMSIKNVAMKKMSSITKKSSASAVVSSKRSPVSSVPSSMSSASVNTGSSKVKIIFKMPKVSMKKSSIKKSPASMKKAPASMKKVVRKSPASTRNSAAETLQQHRELL